MSRALLVVPVVPADAGNGLAMRAGLLLEGLARDHEVRVLVVPVFGDGVVGGFALEHAATVASAPLTPAADRLAELISALGTPEGRRRMRALHPLPRPAAGVGAATTAMVAHAAEDCALVVVMRLYLAPALDDLLERSGRPAVILDLDDLDAQRERRVGDESEAEAYERLAAHFLPRLDAIVVTSDRDARAVERDHGVRAAVIPNGVRPARVAPPAASHDLLFVGNLSYAPNAEGVLWLCHDVLPLLEAVCVAIVGSRPPPAVLELAVQPRVTVVPDVPDVAPWYAGARIATVPLHAGGGTRTKLLEAWAHGVPVVSTTIGAEGLETAGAALIADDPPAFAAACRRLLDDPAAALGMAVRGRELLADSGTAAASVAAVAALAAAAVAGV